MELSEAILKRRSIRRYRDDAVDPILINEVLTLARHGPSAGAIRGFEAIVTTEKLAYDAPLHLVICIDEKAYEPRYGDRGRNLYAIQDAAIYGAYIGLLLMERGLSSCWVGAFREGKIQRIVGTALRPVAIFSVGYAA